MYVFAFNTKHLCCILKGVPEYFHIFCVLPQTFPLTLGEAFRARLQWASGYLSPVDFN